MTSYPMSVYMKTQKPSSALTLLLFLRKGIYGLSTYLG